MQHYSAFHLGLHYLQKYLFRGFPNTKGRIDSQVYRDLSLLEEKYEEVASDDVMSMAVKPSRILTSVR